MYCEWLNQNVHAWVHTHTHTHVRARAMTHAHTNIHKYTFSLFLFISLPLSHSNPLSCYAKMYKYYKYFHSYSSTYGASPRLQQKDGEGSTQLKDSHACQLTQGILDIHCIRLEVVTRNSRPWPGNNQSKWPPTQNSYSGTHGGILNSDFLSVQQVMSNQQGFTRY